MRTKFSRGVVRFVAFLIRQALGWCDAEGNPQHERICVSYGELFSRAGIARSEIRKTLDAALEGGFIECVHAGQPSRAYSPAESASYQLRWDSRPEYIKDPKAFRGFFEGEGNRTDIPNQFCDRVVPTEPLLVIKVVASVIRFSIGFQARHGGRRQEVRLSYSDIRAVQGDFEDFNGNEDQIDYDLADVFKQFDAIDLILDCRFCSSGIDVASTALQIAAFARKFGEAYDKVRRVIVTGSSIPAAIGDVIDVDSTEIVARRELAIIAKARELSEIELISGDYTTVSPFYSDADLDPRIMQNVMTPRLVYPFKDSYYLTRGVSMKSGGQEQYVGLTSDLCEQDFFRPSINPAIK